jgi:hypothetical protein
MIPMEKAALARVLRYARQLAYPDADPRRGPYHAMQRAAVTLDGLQAAVVDYDEVLAILEEDREGGP